MDIFFSGSILAFVEYSIHFKTEHIQVQALAQWSSGMIPASFLVLTPTDCSGMF